MEHRTGVSFDPDERTFTIRCEDCPEAGAVIVYEIDASADQIDEAGACALTLAAVHTQLGLWSLDNVDRQTMDLCLDLSLGPQGEQLN